MRATFSNLKNNSSNHIVADHTVNTSSASSSSINPVCVLRPCKVILNDFLSDNSSTVKSKVLEVNQDINHSVLPHELSGGDYLSTVEKKASIAWPRMDDEESWNKLDSAVFSKLISTPAPSIAKRVSLLETTIFSQASLIFGLTPPPKKGLRGLNRRALYSINLIKEKNMLINQIESNPFPDEKKGLESLLADVRGKLRKFRRGERNRKRRWKLKSASRAFFKNPYQAGKDVLDPKSNVNLETDKDSLDKHKSSSVADPLRNFPLPPLEGLPPAPLIESAFISSGFKRDVFSRVLSTRRNASAPGVNMIPYKVYKKCTQIASFLFKIFTSCLRHAVVPIQWRIASEVYIPKSNPPSPSNIKDFRPISLLNVEGKLFFSLVSKRLENHIITKNKIINTSIQKGCMEKVPGCWEHMSLAWSALKNSKSGKGNLSAIWLDVANAYGSVPHQLIFFALKRYGVPSAWIDLVQAYYNGLWSKSFSDSAPSGWHQHFKGIFIGCTVSIILFLAAINVIIEFCLASAPPQIDPPLPTQSLPMKAFMDDLFLMSPSVASTQALLDRCTSALSWARMAFRATKSRSIVISVGKVQNITPFSVPSPDGTSTDIIPSIHSNPVRFLGRTINVSLSDKDAIEDFTERLLHGLSLIDKSSHRGIHKVWILQHLLIPRLRWPILIYEVSITTIIKLEQKFSSFIRKWLRLHHSISNLCLYSSVSPCPLPIKSLSSVLKSAKVSGHLLLRDSVDPAVSSNVPVLKAGAWSVSEAVVEAERKLDFKKVLGYHQTNRAGLGSFKLPETPETRSHDYRKLIASTMLESDEDLDKARAVQLHLQGNWTKWCDFVKCDLSWKTLLAMPQPLISFVLGATYDTLPSPSNLKRWNLPAEPSCFLCAKSVCTTAHILGACKIALNQGRFTYRHDTVLNELVSSLNTFLETYEPQLTPIPFKIDFVKAGAKPRSKKRSPSIGLLHYSNDWKLLADSNSTLVIPAFITISTLRPDIVLYSMKTKTVVIIELTCPCEENMEAWHTKKFDKYASLCTDIKHNSWSVHFFAVEVGARGYCSETVRSCLRRLGLSGKLCRDTVKSLSSKSMSCSFEIWMARVSRDWTPPTNNSATGGKPVVSSAVSKASTHKPNKSKSSANNVTRKTPERPNLESAKCVTTSHHAGILNKGNTCYINSILQCFSVIPKFWSHLSANQMPFIATFQKVMSSLQTSKWAIDPSPFLIALKNVILQSGNKDFEINRQQDAAEALEHVISELSKDSIVSLEMLKVLSRTISTCDFCSFSQESENTSSVTLLPVSSNVQTSLLQFLNSGQDEVFCHACSCHRNMAIDRAFVSCGRYLIIQLNRFCNRDGKLSRNFEIVHCFPGPLSIPVQVDGEVAMRKNYHLVATINHEGTLNSGHYWAYIKDHASASWLHCNDRAVVPANSKKLNNSFSYILFYEVAE